MEPELRTILSGLRFLHGSSDALVDAIASVASLKDYPKGAIVFREGQKEACLYMIVNGAVSLEFCAPGVGCKRLQTVGGGELLGWSPALGLAAMSTTARVVDPTTAVILDAKQLLALFERDTGLGYEFMRRVALVMTQRLGAARLQMLNVCSEQMPVATP
jgi:CRP/FNR family cyclic AMP-dependent transcriptional regulator